MKKITYTIVAFSIFLFTFFAVVFVHEKKMSISLPSDYKNGTYVISDIPVTLINGKKEVEVAPSSASKITTQYFGNEIKKDLNGDGLIDVAFLLTQNAGGSGTFYYVVAAVATKEGYRGSKSFFLGDRIAPQTTESGADKTIIVNYAERKSGASFSDKPSIGKSKYLLFDEQKMVFEEISLK